MKPLRLSLLLLFLISCGPSGHQAEEGTSSPDSLLAVPTDTTALVDSTSQTSQKPNVEANGIVRPYALASPTRIFASPDTMSDVIGVLRFNTPVQVLGADTVVGMFFEIVHGNVKGFVLEGDLALRTYPSSIPEHRFRYYVVNEAVYKLDEAKNMFVDTFRFSGKPSYAIRILDSLRWKNVDALIQTIDDAGCCGCTLYDHYFMDTQNRLDSIFTTWTFLDDSDEPEGLECYLALPQDAEKGLIHFYEDHYSPTYDKQGKESERVRQKISTYYKWDGTKMNLVKKVKH